MEHPLVGFALKMNRAEVHLNSIKRARDDLTNVNFYDIVTEPDYKRRPTARFRNVSAIDPSIGVLIGDCVHNFRSALDHLAFQLAVGHTDPMPEQFVRSSAFPIFNSRDHYRGKRPGSRGAAPKMRGMSRFARGAIERLQPYHRRKNPALWSLWQLDEMWQMDKHRLVHLATAAPRGARVWAEGLNANRVGIQQFARPIEEGAILARILGDLPSPEEVKVKAKITPEIIFDKRIQAESVRSQSVIDTLGAIRETIGFHVLPELDRELHRLFPRLRLQITVDHGPIPSP